MNKISNGVKIKTVKQIKELAGKKVLLRAGFDCPIRNGKVIDASRIEQTLPTIRYLTKKKAKVIIISHLGRPLEQKNIKAQKHKNTRTFYSLRPVFRNLRLKIKGLKFIDDRIGPKVEKIIKKMKPGEIILLENLRFYPGEEKNDAEFAKKLAGLADIYVNEAFSVSHRRNASLVAINKYLPAYAGILLEKEITNLSAFLRKQKHPLIVLMAGKKIETKIKPIRNLLKKADKVLIAGALASNFLKAAGYGIGRSFWEPRMLDTSRRLLKNRKIVLPVDLRIKTGSGARTVDLKELNDLGEDFEILDIGPDTIKTFEKYLKSARMIFWNGPAGYFEDKRFRQGTVAVARAIIGNKKAQTVIGGGETLIILKDLKPRKNVFVSTGGGAMLEFLEGKILQGIRPLIKKN